MIRPSASSVGADVRLYIYDTSNGWCAQTKMGSDAFHVAAGNAPGAADAAWLLVTNVMELQAQGRTLSHGSGLQLPSDAADLCMSSRQHHHLQARLRGLWQPLRPLVGDDVPFRRPGAHPAPSFSHAPFRNADTP